MLGTAPHEGHPCTHLPGPCRGSGLGSCRPAAPFRRPEPQTRRHVTSTKRTMDAGHTTLRLSVSGPVRGLRWVGVGDGGKSSLVFFFVLPAHRRRRTSGCFTLRCCFTRRAYVTVFERQRSARLGHQSPPGPGAICCRSSTGAGSDGTRGRRSATPASCTRCEGPDEHRVPCSVEPLRQPTYPLR